MTVKKVLEDVRDNIAAVTEKSSPLGTDLWKAFIELHPADIAQFFGEIRREDMQALFLCLPEEIRIAVFALLSYPLKAFCLSFMNDEERVVVLHALPTDELADLFDHLSDEELQAYLVLLHKNVRQQVLSLLRFDPESAGGIMDTDVLTLMADTTVEKSIKLLQRVQPRRDVHQQIYVTNRDHRLEGNINLEDLVLHRPDEKISSFMHKNELVARAQEDREEIAHKMVHYGLMTVPVVDDNNYFLGVIPSETLVDVIVQEATEDVQKMAALAPMKLSYFETPLWRIFYQRGYILVALLIAESASGAILEAHEAALTALLISFIPMLISTGGNASNQTSAVVIQGLASGEISDLDATRFLRREFIVAFFLALLLSTTSFLRVYMTSQQACESFVVAFTIWCIVLLSATLGSTVPMLLRRLNIDPAFSAGPFLATVMDIIGVLIFCYVSRWILC